MSANEGLQPLTNPTAATVDPNVHVPDHVRQAAEAADALHKATYAPPAENSPQPNSNTPEPSPQPDPAAEEAARAAAAAAQVQNPPADDGFTAPADAAALKDSEWARRYNSMRGRYVALERQMGELSQELVRTQNLLASVQQAPPAPQPTARGQDHGNLITDQDRESYGEELIDLARRAGREAVAPELDALRAENARLTQRVQTTGKRELFERMDREIPTWRSVNKDTRFLAWLRLPNVYTGQLRGNMLKAAVDGANAPQALQVFRDFLAEAHATGMIAPAQQIEQQAQPAPREPALALDALAAPGRARPASGDSQVPGEKPIYSRADIAKFYDDKRRGFYAGRDAEVQAFEADLTAAQREGRIR